jgi:capsid protein
MSLISRLKTAGQALFSPAQSRRQSTLAMAPGYEAAGYGRRLAGFNPTADAINTLLIGGGVAVRSRSRKLVRENAWAEAAIDNWCSSAIGTGIVPEWKP